MNFITIIDNKVVSTRQGQTIVEGETENIDNLQCGMELINGEWVLPSPLPQQPSEIDKIKERVSATEDALMFLMDMSM